MKDTLAKSVQTLMLARSNAQASVECNQLIFIISDGRTFPERYVGVD